MTIDGVTGSRIWLVPFLLLCVREGGACGRELTEQIWDLGFGGMRPGEVYRVLRGMVGEGIVASFREGGKISPSSGVTRSRPRVRPAWSSGRIPWSATATRRTCS